MMNSTQLTCCLVLAVLSLGVCRLGIAPHLQANGWLVNVNDRVPAPAIMQQLGGQLFAESKVVDALVSKS